MRRNPRLRMYIRLNASGQAIPGSSILRYKKPTSGRWVDITDAVELCCTTTTTTTSTTSTTTTTTTTT